MYYKYINTAYTYYADQFRYRIVTKYNYLIIYPVNTMSDRILDNNTALIASHISAYFFLLFDNLCPICVFTVGFVT